MARADETNPLWRFGDGLSVEGYSDNSDFGSSEIDIANEYYTLSHKHSLSEAETTRMGQILEAACHSDRLSLLLNEINEMVWQEERLAGSSDMQHHGDQRARVSELTGLTGDKAVGKNIPAHKVVFEHASLNLTAYEHTLARYYRLLRLPVLSEADQLKMSHILEEALQDELLSLLLDIENEAFVKSATATASESAAFNRAALRSGDQIINCSAVSQPSSQRLQLIKRPLKKEKMALAEPSFKYREFKIVSTIGIFLIVGSFVLGDRLQLQSSLSKFIDRALPSQIFKAEQSRERSTQIAGYSHKTNNQRDIRTQSDISGTYDVIVPPATLATWSDRPSIEIKRDRTVLKKDGFVFKRKHMLLSSLENLFEEESFLPEPKALQHIKAQQFRAISSSPQLSAGGNSFSAAEEQIALPEHILPKDILEDSMLPAVALHKRMPPKSILIGNTLPVRSLAEVILTGITPSENILLEQPEIEQSLAEQSLAEQPEIEQPLAKQPESSIDSANDPDNDLDNDPTVSEIADAIAHFSKKDLSQQMSDRTSSDKKIIEAIALPTPAGSLPVLLSPLGSNISHAADTAQFIYPIYNNLDAAVTYTRNRPITNHAAASTVTSSINLSIGNASIGGHYTSNHNKDSEETNHYGGKITVKGFIEPGNELGLYGGVQHSAGGAQANLNTDNSFLFEAYYHMPLNEQFTFTPSVIYNGNGSEASSNDNVYGTIRAWIEF